jgi:centromeric protein E
MKSNQYDTLMNEGRHINTSLFYLCQVITRLSEKKGGSEFIPYRNSNLTKLLRSSLGGNSKTCIICTATQTLSQFEMTLSTLRFGGTASTITNKVAANIRTDKHAEILAAY